MFGLRWDFCDTSAYLHGTNLTCITYSPGICFPNNNGGYILICFYLFNTCFRLKQGGTAGVHDHQPFCNTDSVSRSTECDDGKVEEQRGDNLWTITLKCAT